MTNEDKDNLLLVQGAKKGAQKPPVEAPNSLKSVAMARIVDLISEGEIVGLVNDLKSVYLDETPVQNSDNSLNFSNVSLEWRNGTQTQEYLKGFPGVESELGVNVELKDTSPWTRSITNTNLNAVRVRLSTPALTKTDTSTGDTTGLTINYVIDLSVDGGPFTPQLHSSFSGKCLTKYERDHRIDLPAATSGWQIRVRRLTANATTGNIQDKTFVESIVEIVDAKLRYPHSAVAGIIVAAEQFTSVPSRAYDIKGRIIRVPANYDPVTRTYATTGTGTSSGSWDGTFKLAWTDNPAWVYYDLVTHPRYGLGHIVSDAMVNKWELYKIAQYCDQLVPDGKGGQEPRFACNLVLTRQADAYKVIQDLATVFRGIAYWGGGEIIAVSDKPEDAVYTYTPANVIDGMFTYQGSAQKKRYTVALVSWNNPEMNYRSAIEYIDDQEGIARYGIQQTDMTAIACTSQGQAQRVGRYILATSLYETQMVSFRVGMDGTLVAPGKIVRIADPLRAGRRTGGRVRSATTTIVTVDSLPSPAPVVGDTLTCIMSSGVSQSRVISAINTTTNAITVSVGFTEAPAAETVWATESVALQNQLYRIMSIGESEPGIYDVSAVQHVPSKFSAVDNKTRIDVPNTTGVSFKTMSPPTNVVATSRQTIGQVLAATVVTVSWDAAPNAAQYEVEYRRDNGEWVKLPRTTSLVAEVANAWPGTYEVRVAAINNIGVSSAPAAGEPLVVADHTALPLTLQTLEDDVAAALQEAENAQAVADGAVVSFWTPNPPIIGSESGEASEGDIWFDTNDGNKIWRVVSGVWTLAADDDMAAALAAASTAQATADGKVKTYFQSGAPTGTLAIGDLWFNTSTKALFRWNGVDWSSQVSDITADQLSGRGVNLIPDEISIPEAAMLPAMDANSGGTITRDTATTYFGFGSYKMVSTTSDQYHRFKTPIKLTSGKKYLLSMYVNSSVACTLQAYFDAGANGNKFVNLSTAPTAGVWTRVSAVVDLSSGVTAGTWDFQMRIDNHGATGVTSYVEGIMLEEMIGNLTTPSAFVRSLMANRISDGEYRNGSMGFVFRDAFDHALAFNRWKNYSATNSELSIVTDSTSVMGGSIMRIGNNSGNDEGWLINQAIVPFDATKLYRIRARVRRNSGAGSLFLGLAGWAADKTTLVTSDGTANHSGQHYVVASNVTPAIGTWVEYTGYVKGYSSGNGDTSPSTSMTAPRKLHPSVRHISPIVIVNYPGVPGQVDIDYFIIEDADALALANSKAATFNQEATPTATNVGDTWYKPSEQRTYIWSGTAWSLMADQTESTINNYINNPGWEQGRDVGWGDAIGNGLSGWYTENGGITGSRRLVRDGASGGGTSGIYQSAAYGGKAMPVVAGQRVRSQLTVYRMGANGSVSFGMAFYDSNGTHLESSALYNGNINPSNAPEGQWKTHTYYQTAPANAASARFCIGITAHTAGYWFFDNAAADYQPSNLDEIPDGNVRAGVNRNDLQNGRLPPYSFGDELVVNGGFEQELSGRRTTNAMPFPGEHMTDGWFIWETASATRCFPTTIETNPEPRSGVRSLFIGNLGGEVIPAGMDAYTIVGMRQMIPVTAGEQFVIRAGFWENFASAIPSGITQNQFLGMRYFDGNMNYLGQVGLFFTSTSSARALDGNKTFRKEALSVAPAGAVHARVIVYLQMVNNTGSNITLPWAVSHTRVDDVSIRRIAAAGKDASGSNMLINADWSQGDTGWSGAVGNYSYDNGTKGLAFSLGAGAAAYVWQDISQNVFAGEMYSAAFNARVANPVGDGHVRIYLEYFSGGTQIGSTAPDISQNPNTFLLCNEGKQSKRLELNGNRVPTGTTSIRLVMVIYGGSNGIVARIDSPKFERGIISTPYSGSVERTYGGELTRIGSRRLLGGPRNIPSNVIMGSVSVRTATALSANSSGQVTVNAHSVELNGETVTYNGVTNAVVGLTPGASYVIYTIDPNSDGGTRTWYAAGNMLQAQQQAMGVVIAGVVTIPTSGTSSGGGGGGGNPNDWCVDADMVLADGRIAADIQSGDYIACWNDDPSNPSVELIEVESNVLVSDVPAVCITTESGAKVVASTTTPMTLRDGRIVKITEMYGEEALVKRGASEPVWERVTFVAPAGNRTVAKIKVHQRCYFAGFDSDVTIATHNPNAKP